MIFIITPLTSPQQVIAMAPKSSQRTSLGSNQPQPFEAALTKLCNAIDNAKAKKGEIKYVTCLSNLRKKANSLQSTDYCH